MAFGPKAVKKVFRKPVLLQRSCLIQGPDHFPSKLHASPGHLSQNCGFLPHSVSRVGVCSTLKRGIVRFEVRSVENFTGACPVVGEGILDPEP